MVLDCSATLAWLYGDERSVEIEVLLEQVVEHGATVPALCHLEVANALTVAVRRGRITAEFRNAALDDLAKLAVVTDAETERHAWGAAVRLADLHALTVYDAAYLELAQRTRLPLATLDAALVRAAAAAGVEVLP